jgi:acyl-CoA reductase-like NAD-dependent aldehyde dehydrogenase
MSVTENRVVQAVNPRTGEIVGEYPPCTAQQYERALADAAQCAVEAQMADDDRRAVVLRATAARLRERAEAIIGIAGEETGLPSGRLRGELERTCLQLEMFAQIIAVGEHLEPIIDSADPEAQPAPRPDLRRQQLPIGPVAVFGASNFPLAFSTAGGDTASALAAGCPVVVKGHPAHPGTAQLVATQVTDAVRDAGLPAGAFAQLLSADVALGERLVDDPRIAAIAFTGSFAAGRAIAKRASERDVPIPVFAEMGSLNPVVITPAAANARGPAIAEALAGSVATFGGQLCTKPGVAFVSDTPAGHALVDALGETLSDHDPEVLLTRAIHDRFQDGVREIASAAGVTRVTSGGDRCSDGSTASRPQLFSTLLDMLDHVDALREEHFGPALIVFFYTDLDGVAGALGRLGGQLTISLHSESDEHPSLVGLVAAISRLCGRVVFDGYPTGVSVCWSMHHGGPYPATTASATTSVGATALRRFQRPVVLQNAPAAFLPAALADGNPRGLRRRVDGNLLDPR